MAWVTPTLPALIDRVRAAFRAELPGSDAWVWPNNITPTAKVVAGAVFELFGRLDWRMRQMFASTAEGDYIARHAYELGLSRRPAAPATGTAIVTATGPYALDGAALFRSSAGQDFRALAAASISGAGTLDVALVAVSDGAAGNLAAGAPLEAVSGVTGAGAVVVAAGGITGGADVESDESLRARVLFRKRNPPHGGAPADYVGWAMEVSGVTRVFVERLWSGAGTVRVFVLMDELYADGIPPSGEVARVRGHLEAVVPASAGLTVAPPVAVPVDITISGLSPDTTAVREAIRAELRDMLLRRAGVSGADSTHPAMPWLASPFTLSRSWVSQAISDAADEARHVLVEPPSDITFAAGEIPVLGDLDFV